MTPDLIRETVLKAIFSREELADVVVLKGGNALRLHGLTDRQSMDLDFSIKEAMRFSKELEGRIFEEAITSVFMDMGYVVTSFTFSNKPRKRNQQTPPFWGGYSITFNIVSEEKYMAAIGTKHHPNVFAEALENDKRKVEIDLSFDEYVEDKVAKEIDGVTVYMYSPLMIIYEKIRASCQQLEGYPLTSNQVRARDLYDIYSTLTHHKYVNLRKSVLDENNFYILKKMFDLKMVDINLLMQLSRKKDALQYDYENNVRAQIPPSKGSPPDFEFLFSYSQELFQTIHKKYINYYS